MPFLQRVHVTLSQGLLQTKSLVIETEARTVVCAIGKKYSNSVYIPKTSENISVKEQKASDMRVIVFSIYNKSE